MMKIVYLRYASTGEEMNQRLSHLLDIRHRVALAGGSADTFGNN